MRSLLILAALSAASCHPRDLQGVSGNAFQQAVAGRTAGPAQSCISTQPNQNLGIIDAATVFYEVGPTIWINRLQAACPGLSPYNSVILERSAAQICRGDRVRGLEPGANIPGPSCNLQDWIPYRRP